MSGIPEPQGTLHEPFIAQMAALQEQAAAIAEAFQLQNQRVWQQPDKQEWDGDPLDIPGLVKAFDRQKIGDNFTDCVSDAGTPGTVGDVVSLKVQSDYTAAMERAYRTRQATTIRCLAHASGRRAGHGDAAGIFSDASGALCYAADALQAGQTVPPYGGVSTNDASEGATA